MAEPSLSTDTWAEELKNHKCNCLDNFVWLPPLVVPGEPVTIGRLY
jgi:hypothetical protein